MNSRQNGWEFVRERLKNVTKPERPRLFVFNTCRHFIQKAAVLPHDEIDMDDVDSKAEDHVAESGIHPRDERKKKVPQPLRASLSLRNKRFWNQDWVFGSRVQREQRRDKQKPRQARTWHGPVHSVSTCAPPFPS